MSGLILNNTLDVVTDYGLRQIQLCVGSVTKLEDSVDVLVVSSFPGDYTPVPTTVIGALKNDLQINVSKLAKDKQEDLRNVLSCWWSKPLKGRFPFPFNQILCFEGGFKKNLQPPSTVGDIFRCLVSLCKDKEISVIMPLLSTGNQSFSSQMMLRLIVEAAVHWMKAGLPLKTLKIVVYQPNTKIISSQSKLLINYFQTLKNSFIEQEKQLKETEKQKFIYDIYLSYSPKDCQHAAMFMECLRNVNPDIRIYSEQQVINPEKSWQDEMYEIIIQCKRVLVLLSPDFLQNVSCVEQYNIALCCSRKMGRQYLAPIYLEEIIQMPTYMGLIQYIECRPVTKENVKTTCNQLLLNNDHEDSKNSSKEKTFYFGKEYDLFISYSHKDTEIANMIYNFISKLKPHWNIFIDQLILKAGTAWQTKLYESIENSGAVLALLSNNYLNSKVCQEEFNLARALCEDKNYTCVLVEVMLEKITQWPVWCTPSCSFDYTKSIRNETRLYILAGSLAKEKEFSFESPMEGLDVVLSVKQTTATWRRNFAEQNFPITTDADLTSKVSIESYNHQPSDVYDIILSFHESDRSISEMLNFQLKALIPNLNIFLQADGKDSPILHVLDQGKIVIPLLSKSYVTTPSLMEEFNTALCRHRFSKQIVIFPIIVRTLPKFPLFPLLTFCMFSTEDDIWMADKVESCIKTAAVVVANIIILNPTFEHSFKTLLSMRELESWNADIAREKTLSALLFTSNDSSHQVTVATTNHLINSMPDNQPELKNKNLDQTISLFGADNYSDGEPKSTEDEIVTQPEENDEKVKLLGTTKTESYSDDEKLRTACECDQVDQLSNNVSNKGSVISEEEQIRKNNKKKSPICVLC